MNTCGASSGRISRTDSLTVYSTLIGARDLAPHVADAGWSIFDCRHGGASDVEAGARAYAEGHIPGARFAHLDRNLAGVKTGGNGRHPLPTRDEFVGWLRSEGVSDASQVVAYDAQGGIYAARLWWMLRWIGHEAVAVLDGGIAAWTREGNSLTQDSPGARTGNIVARAGVTSVDAAFVESHLGSREWKLVDARSPDRFRGENETLDPVGGHIPGAVNRYYIDNLAADGRFKNAAVLRQEWLKVLGDVHAADSVQQCGSGVTAAHNLLALEVAGLKGSRLYPGSWSEWVADPARPIATNGP
jgi:thiosulfate/3-mercaptopyruvate sulfurtransferase